MFINCCPTNDVSMFFSNLYRDLKTNHKIDTFKCVEIYIQLLTNLKESATYFTDCGWNLFKPPRTINHFTSGNGKRDCSHCYHITIRRQRWSVRLVIITYVIQIWDLALTPFESCGWANTRDSFWNKTACILSDSDLRILQQLFPSFVKFSRRRG